MNILSGKFKTKKKRKNYRKMEIIKPDPKRKNISRL